MRTFAIVFCFLLFGCTSGQVHESERMAEVSRLNSAFSSNRISFDEFSTRVLMILHDAEREAASAPSTPLVFSDIAFTCISLLDQSKTFAEECKRLYRLAISDAKSRSDIAALVNAAPMLRYIADDDAFSWLLGLGKVADQRVAAWAMSEARIVIEDLSGADTRRAKHLYDSFEAYCGDPEIAEAPDNRRAHCQSVVSSLSTLKSS